MDYAAARRNMVECQLRTNRVTDAAIIAAMGSIPRERFVPEDKAAVAYVDEDLPIGQGRYLMEPMVLGRQLQALAPNADEVALCVGCGTGYSAAVLSRLTRAVFALDCDSVFIQKMNDVFAELGYDNAVAVEGELSRGWPDETPYNVILFDGAVEEIPDLIFDQLAEGGRIIAVYWTDGAQGRATLMQKLGGFVSRREVFDANIPVLSGFQKSAGFVF